MHDSQILACSLISLFLLLIIPSILAINLVPVEPLEGQVFNTTNNVTFACNATDDGLVLNLSLYHNLNGTFSKNQTEYYTELPFDSNTSFLCHFNGGLECQAGGSGNPVANDSLSFQQGKFSQGLHINETGLLRYQTSGNFDRNQGTIEFWISPPDDISSKFGYIFQAADNGADDINQMEIYFVSGMLRFEIIDNPEGVHMATSGISSWAAGSWHHVAAVWDLDGNIGDGSPLDIYTDGELQESYVCDQCGFPIPYYSTSSSFSIGSSKNNDTQANAIIDEFRISGTVRSASEINQSYYNGLADYSSVSNSWDFYNVSDGSYIWRCIAYNNDLESNQSAIINFYVDMSTQPTVNAILPSPNSSDEIDPGTAINVTANVSDPSGVDAVIFQWKEAEEESWHNITMTYNASSGLYDNASFQTSIMEGDYYFRIWSNDTTGSSGYSPNQNVTSGWDFTWARSPASFGTASGLINSRSNVGILAINNTGDRTLNFTLYDNWPLYYNGSDNSNFYVTNHTAITINVTADFASSDSENDITITINASHYSNPPSLSPVSLTTNATINSYSGGPYLSVSIMEYSGMVSQSQTFNLSARVKNIGNETAEDAWLNWSLPTGWVNTSGSVTQSVGNLSSGSSFTSNITITIDPSSASPGTFIIYADSSCVQNVSGLDSKTVGVSCSDSDGVCGYGCSYVNDQDCGIPTSPGGGTVQTVQMGGGGGETFNYAMAAEAISIFDMNREERKSLAVRISNTGKRSTLRDIRMDVAGYPLTHVKIIPQAIARLEAGQSGLFEMEFFAPVYMRYGVHNITLSIAATGSSNFTSNLTRVERLLRMSVVVHSARENETLRLAEEVREALLEMESLGLGTGKVSGLLEKAEAQISEWDYDTAMDNLKACLEARDKAMQIMGLIGKAEGSVREAEIYGVQTPETRKMNELSKAALAREDYARAEERANSALAAYAMEARMIDSMKFFHTYWQALLGAFSLSLAAGYLGRRRTLRNRVLRRIDHLSGQEKALRKMEEKAKEDYYKKGLLSSGEYHSLMAGYGTDLAKLRRRKSELIGKLASLKGKKAEEAFRERERYARKEIEDCQRKYFEQGSLSKSDYKKGMKELREELVDSLQSMETIERRRNKRQKLAAANFQPSTPSGRKEEERRRAKGTCRILPIFAVAALLAFSNIAVAQDSGMKVAEPLSSQNERMKVTLSPSSQEEKQSALDAMGNAEYIIGEMKGLGIPASRANDTLNEARLLFSKGFYRGAESLAREVEGIRDTAMALGSRADGLESYMYEVSLEADVSEAREIFEEGLDALEYEQYEKADELFSQAQARLEEIQSRASLERAMEAGTWENTLSLLRKNILLIVISAIVLASAAVLGARLRKRRRAARRKASLLREKERISGSMKEIQSRYFGQGKIGREEYEAMMGRCRKRLAGINRQLLAMEPHKDEKPAGREKADSSMKPI